MTSYSVLHSGSRATVIATWPGEWSDHSTKVTTLAAGDHASDLALVLTRLSEGAWDAAVWLDTSPAIEVGITALIGQLRGPAETIDGIHASGDGFRHTDEWSFTDVKDLLAQELPVVVNRLSRAQRLTVADELSADSGSRTEALQVLPTGQNPQSTSRAWQACEVTRSLRNGQTGPLPEGGAGWLVRSWGPDHSPAERWAARSRLVRIEQLVAACRAHGGRAVSEDDPLRARLVVPHGDDAEGDEAFDISVHDGNRNSWKTDPFAPMTVTRSGSIGRQSEDLGELDPADDDGFAQVLGDWTRAVPYHQ